MKGSGGRRFSDDVFAAGRRAPEGDFGWQGEGLGLGFSEGVDFGLVVDLNGVVFHVTGMDVDEVKAIEWGGCKRPGFIVVGGTKRSAPAPFSDINRSVRM